MIEQMTTALGQISEAMRIPLHSKKGQPLICFRQPGLDYHEAGTCRMGDDPLTSAADRYGQIHGVKGLYVADNSMIPTLGAANPTLTTVALSIRTADVILGRFVKEEV